MVTPEDCSWFFIKQCKLNLLPKQIFECYAFSKQTIIADHEKDSALKYRKMVFMEFLEMIARIALTYFKNIEAEEWPLTKKIQSLMDEIFPVLGHKRVE